MKLDASDDHRYICRTCNRPRLKMVALLPEGETRRKHMAGPVCIDRHPARPGVTYPVPEKETL